MTKSHYFLFGFWAGLIVVSGVMSAVYFAEKFC